MEKNKNKGFSDDNIFSELSKEIEKSNEENIATKNGIYYIKLASYIIGYVNLFLLFTIGTVFGYNYFQNTKNSIFENEFIKSNCNLFLGKEADSIKECMSVTTAINKYKSKTKDLDKKIKTKLKEILPGLIKIENLTFSDNISFLAQKSKNKSEPLQILADFDKLKNEFLGDYQNYLVCDNIEIKNNILTANCNTYSKDRNNSIVGFSGKVSDNKSRVGGTSISKAASFLNFIDKNPNSNFKNIEKQKTFKYEDVYEDNWMTKKTPFKIKLQYQYISNLSI